MIQLMTKENILFWAKNLMAATLFVLYVAYFKLVQFNTVFNFITLISLLIIFAIGIRAFVQKDKIINYDNMLNTLKIIIYFIISLLLYRTMFDYNMLYSYVNSLDASSASMFYRANEVYVLIITIGLLCYNTIILKDKNITKKKILCYIISMSL